MTMSVVYSNAFGGVVAENRGGTVSTYVPDTLGNTIGLMNSAGTLTDRWTYWPFGETNTRTGTTATPLTFLGILGYFQDVASKLFYVRARHLRADLARWLTVDPLWPRQPQYDYCQAQPVLYADPSGLLWGCSYSYPSNQSCFISGLGITCTACFNLCLCIDDIGMLGTGIGAIVGLITNNLGSLIATIPIITISAATLAGIVAWVQNIVYAMLGELFVCWIASIDKSMVCLEWCGGFSISLLPPFITGGGITSCCQCVKKTKIGGGGGQGS